MPQLLHPMVQHSIRSLGNKNKALELIVRDRLSPLASMDSDAGARQVEQALVQQFAYQLEADPRRIADIKLAAQLASGNIQEADSTVYGLMRYLGHKVTSKIQGNRRRLNTSAPAGLSDQLTADVGFHLAQACANKEAMKMFGYHQPAGATSLNFHIPGLPVPFMALESRVTQRMNVKCALTRLKCRAKRLHVVGFDETNFIPGLVL